jgi:hypothetical protein
VVTLHSKSSCSSLPKYLNERSYKIHQQHCKILASPIPLTPSRKWTRFVIKRHDVSSHKRFNGSLAIKLTLLLRLLTRYALQPWFHNLH